MEQEKNEKGAGRLSEPSGGKTIFLPGTGQLSQMMESAWQAFVKDAAEHGLMPAGDIFKDFFMAGYSYGYNDVLDTIRGQLQAMDMASGSTAEGSSA